ncbi:PASTA domain-containing protein [Micromonospora sp. DT233]|uniref:PASTA domain-containing protein n=1 Tax=Micromonospora sp. DT233 TaxID=3393432 RepID=UPI003CF33102
MSDDRQGLPPDGADDADDRTRPLPRPPDRTRPLPGAGETAQQPAAPPVWSGRAGVPPPRPANYRDPASDDWYAEEQRGRPWWLPILLGILALLLLGVIGAGVWLALSADDDSGPEPTPSAPASTAPATTGAPTTGGPSTTPPPSTAASVPMPPVVGLPRAVAVRVLGQAGIGYRIESRESDRPPGTVLDTDPGPGEPVAAGQEVTLVVAVAPTSTPGAVTPTPTPTPTVTPTP